MKSRCVVWNPVTPLHVCVCAWVRTNKCTAQLCGIWSVIATMENLGRFYWLFFFSFAAECDGYRLLQNAATAAITSIRPNAHTHTVLHVRINSKSIAVQQCVRCTTCYAMLYRMRSWKIKVRARNGLKVKNGCWKTKSVVDEKRQTQRVRVRAIADGRQRER